MSTEQHRLLASPTTSLSSFSLVSSHSRSSTFGRISALDDDTSDDEIVFSPHASLDDAASNFHDWNNEDDFILIASPASRALSSPPSSLASSMAGLLLGPEHRDNDGDAEDEDDASDNSRDFAHGGPIAADVSAVRGAETPLLFASESAVPFADNAASETPTALSHPPQLSLTSSTLTLGGRAYISASYPSPSPSPSLPNQPATPRPLASPIAGRGAPLGQPIAVCCAKQVARATSARKPSPRKKEPTRALTPALTDDSDDDDAAYQDAVDYVSNFLSNPNLAKPSSLPLLQALIIELGLCTPASDSLPASVRSAKALLKANAHINVRDYVAQRDKGLPALQSVMFPNRSRLVRDLRTRRVPIKWVKQHGLNIFLTAMF